MKLTKTMKSDDIAVSSTSEMPHPPRKIKATDEVVKFSFLLDAEMARELDRIATEMRKVDPFDRPVNRTDVLRAMLKMGVEAYRKTQK